MRTEILRAATLLALMMAVSLTPASAETCNGLNATIIGSGAADDIDGTPGNDVIVAKGGNDFVTGQDGYDVICGNGGSDTLHGGGGGDDLFGGRGRDYLIGGHGDNYAFGQGGNDRLLGGLPNASDYLDGGNGYDECSTGPYVTTVRCECFPPFNQC